MSARAQTDQRQSERIRAVVLDYDLVLCRAPGEEHLHRMATALRVDHHTFWRLYEQSRGPLDKGDLTPAAYWKSLAREAKWMHLRSSDCKTWISTCGIQLNSPCWNGCRCCKPADTRPLCSLIRILGLWLTFDEIAPGCDSLTYAYSPPKCI
jgi:hypothetical protein